MGSKERRQDVWAVTVSCRNHTGVEILHQSGVVLLPHPMTAFEAADRAVRIKAKEIGERAGKSYGPHAIHAVIWGKREEGRHPGWSQQCGALAEYDTELGVFMRSAPWLGDGAQETVKKPEGAEFLSADWH